MAAAAATTPPKAGKKAGSLGKRTLWRISFMTAYSRDFNANSGTFSPAQILFGDVWCWFFFSLVGVESFTQDLLPTTVKFIQR